MTYKSCQIHSTCNDYKPGMSVIDDRDSLPDADILLLCLVFILLIIVGALLYKRCSFEIINNWKK